MLSFYRRYWRTAFDIALIIATVYLFMWIFSFLYNLATPIFLALVVYLVIEPPARFLHRRGLKKSIASAISVVTFTLIILGGIFGLGLVFYNQIQNLADSIPYYAEVLRNNLEEQTLSLTERYDSLPEDVTAQISGYLGELSASGGDVAKWLLSNMVNGFASFSTFMINFGIALILAYFLSVEIETWKGHAQRKTPKTFKAAFQFLRENVLIGILAYIKAQMKLISITFSIVFAGLLIFGVKNAFSLALLAALLDLLPLLGVPVLFVPWIVYLFVVGNTVLAVKLIVLYIIAALVRQLAEPKITGDSLGVSAFTMLSFMIISLSLFGVAGLILAPILIITVKALWEQGYIKQWIRKPIDEYNDERSEFSLEDATKKE